MNSVSESRNSSSEELVAEAVDRFMEEARRGDRPDIEDYAARYPEAAQMLRSVLPALAVLQSGESESGDEPPPPGKKFAGRLGDYRIGPEIGRGGMGVVYEAEQVSLGRRVALKVLPFAATMDQRQLLRFHNEARAAACLHHPNIVPIFSVGCKHGVHYYAMQFIEGQSLEALIHALRSDQNPQAPAADSNRTTDQPHNKPSNTPREFVLAAETRREPRTAVSTLPSQQNKRAYFRRIAELGIQAAEALEHAHQAAVIHRDIKPANLLLDESGKLWVTDFGLAQINTDTRLTMTGDLVGTLRYMSPEQALAKRVIIDHRTDIYSLGATLYELMTLTPVFSGKDRQELMRQIAFEEPVLPRRISKAIPAELETVILKALEKNPADRYGTANEVADDLRRFLNDEPTLARRPTLWQRTKKWSRRHVAAVRATGVALLVTLTVVAATAGWWLRDRSARETETERAVGSALHESDRLQKQWKLPEALAKARQAEEIMLSGATTPALTKSVQARLADLTLAVELEEIRATGAEQVLEAAGGGVDPATVIERYRDAFWKNGIDVVILPLEEAAKRIRDRTVIEELAAALDDWASFVNRRDKRAQMHLLAVARAADPDPLRNQLRQALEKGDLNSLKLVLANAKSQPLAPPTVVAIARALGNGGAWDEAVALVEECQMRHPGDFWINFQLGLVLGGSQTAESAKLTPTGTYRKGPEWTDRAGNLPKYDDSIRFYMLALAIRPQSAIAHHGLGQALLRKGRYADAIALFRRGILLTNGSRSFYFGLGMAFAGNKQPEEAIAAFRQVLHLNPDNDNAQTRICESLQNQGKADQAIAEFQKAIERKPGSFNLHNNLGVLYGKLGQHENSVAAFRAAIGVKPDSAFLHANLGSALVSNGQIEEGIDGYQRALDLDPGLIKALSGMGNALRLQKRVNESMAHYLKAFNVDPDRLQAHIELGNALRRNGKPDEAIAEYRKALEIHAGYYPVFVGIGNAFFDKGQVDEAMMHYHVALGHSPNYPYAWCQLGYALGKKGQLTDAIAAYRKGIQAKPTLNVLGWFQSSLELGKARASQEFFFLAMARWQLGHRELAKSYYADGVAYMEQNPTDSTDLERFRAEAAEMLGVKDE